MGGILKLRSSGLLYNAAILCASNLGLQGLGFLYRIGLSRLAGAEGLGVYQLVYAVYAVMHAACLAGLTMACARMAAELGARGCGGAVGRLARMAMQVFALLVCGCAVVLFAGRGEIAGHILGDLRTAAVFPVLLLCLALTGVENIIKSLCIGLNRVGWAAKAELTEQIVRITAVLGLLIWYGGRDYGRIALLIFVGMSLSECVSAGLLVWIYYRQVRVPKGEIQPLPKGFGRELAGIVLPVTGAAVVNNLLGSASSVILPHRLMLSGMSRTEALSELGVISGMAMPLLIFPIALISSVCTVLMPEVSRSRARGDRHRIEALTHKAVGVTGLLAIPITAAIVPLAPTLSRLFFGQPLPLKYAALLGVSTVLAYYQMVSAGLLNGMGEQWGAVGAGMLGEMVQLVLVWVLAARPELGIYGYLWAQIIAAALVVCCNMLRLCSLSMLSKALPRLLAIPLVCGAAVFLWVRVLYTFFLGWVGSQWLGVVCTAFSAGGLCLFLLWLLGVRVRDYITPAAAKYAFLWGFY
jgi:stage V sporulation protein B